MTLKQPILIVGGGIGGLSAAIALDRAGIPVALFEKANQVRAIGAGISLWMNAMLALRYLGVESDIRAVSAPFDRAEIQTSRASIVRSLSILGVATELRATPVGVSRVELVKTLHRACGKIPIYTNRKCIRYQQDTEGVTVYFADGSQARGSALIGADGVHSIVRTQLGTGTQTSFAGGIEWRGISKSNHGAEAERGCLFTVLGPLDSGGVGWYVDDHHVSWTVGTSSESPLEGSGCHIARLRDFVRDWKGPLPQLVENTSDECIHLSDHYIQAPITTWGVGRVTLLGDSAHAMGTEFGQGGAQTIEDAVVLAECLKHADNIPSGLRAYEQRRMKRVQLVMNLVQETIGLLLLQFSHPPQSWLRTLAIRFMPAPIVTHRIARIMSFSDGSQGTHVSKSFQMSA